MQSEQGKIPPRSHGAHGEKDLPQHRCATGAAAGRGDFDTALADLDIVRKKHKGTPAGDRVQKRFQRVYILSEARKEREQEAGP